MSFENMKEVDGKVLHERSCMLMYYFTPQEAKQIMNVARLIGIKECIALRPSHGENKIRAILDQQLEESEALAPKQKAIIFNGIPASRVSLFIDGLKKCRINKPIMATVTEQSIDWSLNDLLINLSNERIALKKGTFTEHE